MKTKAAIQVTPDQRLIVDELELPNPNSDEVIVKLISSGVCYSQIHQMHNIDLPRPMVLGHEGTGVVTHVGSNVSDMKEGDYAIVTWVSRTPVKGLPVSQPTGATYAGKPVIGDGNVYTWSEDVLTFANHVVPISKDYATDVSCIVGCAVLTGAGAVMHTAQVHPGNSVAVYGVGGVGLSTICTVALMEAYPVIAVDLDDDKLEFAQQFGATHLVNSSRVDPVEAIQDISGGGVDYAFDAVGVRTTNEQILPSTRGGGPGAGNLGSVAVLVGVPGAEMMANPGHFLYYQRQFRGSLGATYPDKEFGMFLRWSQEGKLPLDKMVTRRYRPDQINDACDALEKGEILGRAIVQYQ
jgi:Zn-dependent alcohol dehydrogenase